jgi:FAD:protein FMN transferase
LIVADVMLDSSELRSHADEAHPRLSRFKKTFMAMACECEIQVDAADAATAEQALMLGIDEVRRIEKKYSRYLPDSFVGQVNAQAGGKGFVHCDQETRELINYANTLYQTSDGLFDMTSGVLRRAWDFKTGKVPEPAEIAELLPLIGWRQVERDGEGIRLPQAGMEIDFGGFGKEYAADRAATRIRSAGIAHVCVNLGGDVRVIGVQANGRPWVAGVREPRIETKIVASIDLYDEALATSGDYERYFEIDGIRYCHILNPKTGWPVRHWQSVSVVAPVAIAAGSYSTIAMLHESRGVEFLQLSGLRYLCIDHAGDLHS